MQPFADMFEGCIEVCSPGAKLHGGQQKDLRDPTFRFRVEFGVES